jgi:hypothetical protein
MPANIYINSWIVTFVAGSLATGSSERCGRDCGTTQHLSLSRLSRQVRPEYSDLYPGLLGVDPDHRICYSGSVSDNPTLLVQIRMQIRILGSALLTNGSGCGSGRPENIRILLIRIRNTGTFTYGSPTLLNNIYFFTCGRLVDE